ncbi:MFS transporter [Deinococcus marmoris]|uniref:Transmembrane efflux protein n=1 Tax=Deinococcus marmoris TaxID=249408 RepID=A0A1U7NRJ7_9DEIO|nr:MFS transporter [Deinococcus marmoris]OLV15540.1 transmembrane efflux protein [Deinococcus marmoris]
MSAPTVHLPPEAHPLDPARWRALAVLLLALFMVLLDTSIVTNGLATLQRDLGASSAQVQFVLTGYAVGYGVLLITGGRLGDLYGRRRLFLLGLAAFTLTSALCGLAWSPLTLIAFRVLQGLAAALLFPQVASFIQVLFPGPERARAFGLQGTIIGLGIIAGPLLGGLLIDANLFGSLWRPIFLVNVPIGLLALLWAARVLPESKSEQARGLDVPGVALLSLALVLLIYPVIEGRDQGWPIWLLTMLALSVVTLGVFVAYQRRLMARGKTPLVQLGMFSDRSFAVGALIAFVFQSSVLSYFVAMSLFFQAGLGYGPTQAALLLISYQFAIVVASLLSARLSARLGRSILLLGTALLMVGLMGILLTLNATVLNYQGYELIPALIVSGLGFGFVIGPLQTVILSRINPANAGSASGVLATVQQVGSALGVAIIGVLLFSHLGTSADTVGAKLQPGLTQTLRATKLPASAVEGITAGFTACVHDRFNQADLNVVPVSCQPSGAALPANLVKPVGTALTAAAIEVRREAFLSALLFTLRFQLAAYALCFGLVFLLPGNARVMVRPVTAQKELTR